MASELIRQQTAGTLTPKGDRDYASEVDYAVERELRSFLARATPSIGLLGEEEGASGASSAREWTLDPVDGTVNFAHGLPLCGVSLALMEAKQPVLGVIDLPFLGERYTAVRGQGAYLNGEPIRVGEVSRLHDAIVSIGDFAIGDRAQERNVPRLAVTAALASQALRVRILGSAALDLAWLAAGRTNAVVTLSNKPWDMAAGIIIAREAGAVVVDADGTEHTADSSATLAAPPALVAEVVELVQTASKRPPG
ncbi:inositol monophosphatase family protein [Natronosporangium hydrolyticum]|uniref:inositol-phosphate phosphatase n=2 Tax=Natronosporangium hydrolyticum TaxID=2811111 RepID=A0A895YTJ4_9ACTN|nr:inositol monophosphatase family protein [Natronosporangium hydrolyticum]